MLTISDHQKILLTLFVFVLPLVFPKPAYSQIIINEFLADVSKDGNENQDEWVELYNIGNQAINITGYVLRDSDDSHELIISDKHTDNTTLQPQSFTVVWRRGAKFSLNNSADKVRLFESTGSGQLVDEFEYAASTENKTWGRVPDGIGGFFPNLDATPAQPNSTPAPDPTPQSTQQPNQPSSPNPTRTPITQNSPSPLPLSSSKAVQTSSPNNSSPSSVLGIFSLIAGKLPGSDNDPSPASDSSKPNSNDVQSHPLFFITSGLFFLGAATATLFFKPS